MNWHPWRAAARWRNHLGLALARVFGLPVPAGPPGDDEEERLIRSRWGGQISPPPQSVTQWHLADLEDAIHEADLGDLSRAAQLCRHIRRDGVVQGILGTRTGGLVRLPKRFAGDPEISAELEGAAGAPGIFEDICPDSELALLDGDGILLGVGVGELLDVEGLDHPVFRRLDPEWLLYRWSEDRWYYRSIAGLLPITPGDGRWVLHCPGGQVAPWNHGLWAALGRAVINKEHALLYRENYSGKLANAARVAVSPQGASEEQHQSWFQKVMAWGVNTVFGLKPGYDVKLLESNGRGYEVFAQTIEKSDQEIIIDLGSSPVLVDGGTGFANADVHESIRADVIQGDGKGLAGTVTRQILRPVMNGRYGAAALRSRAVAVAWDTRPPADMKAEAESLSAAAKAITDLRAALRPEDGMRPDVKGIAQRFAVPVEAIPQPIPAAAPAPVRLLQRSRVGRAWGGLVPVVEWPAGSVQDGVGPDGAPWRRTFLVPYGYLSGLLGRDGEAVDVYIGPDPFAGIAFVVEQLRQDGSPDEDKVLLGFPDRELALEVYRRHVPAWCPGPVHEIAVDQLCSWLEVRELRAVAA